MKLAERDDSVVSLTFTTEDNMEDLVDNDFISDLIDAIVDDLNASEVNIIIHGMSNGGNVTYKIHSKGFDISMLKESSSEPYLLSEHDFEASDYDDDIETACMMSQFSDDAEDDEMFSNIYDDSEDAENIPCDLLLEMKRDFMDAYGQDEEGPCDCEEDPDDV